MKIPLNDLYRTNKRYLKSFKKIINKLISQSNLVGVNQKYNLDFEKNFAKFLNVKYVIGCGNGTDALELALRSLEIGKNDEVIVPALTWISTSEAVNNVNANPVFVDVCMDSNIDCNLIENKISSKTKAIIAVHLRGYPANLIRLKKICKKYKLYLIEDCAQAHGSYYNNKHVGTFGNIGTFSFFPSKSLGAFGDAGCVITNSKKLFNKLSQLRNHGQLKKNKYNILGRNSRLDPIQSVILSLKLKNLKEDIQKKRKIARYFNKNLGFIEHNHNYINDKAYHSFYTYQIIASKRNLLQKKLTKRGIATGIHYPTPLPFIKPYRTILNKDKYLVANFLTSRILSIPIFPDMSLKEANYIIKTLKEYKNLIL